MVVTSLPIDDLYRSVNNTIINMEAQLVPVAEVSLGMVTSSLLGGDSLTAKDEVKQLEQRLVSQ